MQRHNQKETCFRDPGAQRGFTLVELMVVVTIILVLSSFGVFLYNRAIAHAKDTVCKTNLKTLNEAVTLYLEENEAFPASLGQLKREHLEKGYAKAMIERRWHEKLCLLLLMIEESEYAYAQFLTYENLQKYGATQKVFHCPSVPEGKISYGINAEVMGKKISEIKNNTILIADCDSHVFISANQIRTSHSGSKGFAVQKGGLITEVKGSDESGVVNPPDTQPTQDVPPAPAGKTKQSLPADLDSSILYFDDLVNSNRNTPVAEKAEDVRNKLLSALSELSNSPPDTSAAKGNIESAEADLNAMIKERLIDPATGADLKKVLRDIKKRY